MGVKIYYEVSCDHCGCAEHFPYGVNIKQQAREMGWIITSDGKYYDTKKCYKDSKKIES